MSTGHSTSSIYTTLPFFEELDDGRFEEYCTTLLNLNPVIPCLRGGKSSEQKVLSAIRQLGGRISQRGVDIRAKTDRGEEWLFQCKRVKEFGRAAVVKAIDEAEAGFPKADQYVLVTTCGLNPDAITELESRPKWMPWDSSRLTTETQKLRPIENGMNLVTRFFGKDRVKQMFPWGNQPLLKWQEFFSQDLSAERRLFHHRTGFLDSTGALQALTTFARERPGRAKILSAAGGQGKSRLLLELARHLEQSDSNIQVRFLNISDSGLPEDTADLLTRSENLLLIVDDAHRLGSTIADVAQAAVQSTSVRLILATRPHAREAVEDQLFQHGYKELLEPSLSLKHLTGEDLKKLAEEVLGPNHVQIGRLIQLADRCPLLIVVGGALIRSGAIPDALTDEELFRERVFKGFKDDFLSQLPESKRERVGYLIQILSFISPAQKGDALFKMAADVIGCSMLNVAEDLESLKATGLAMENKEGIRLYPDLFADAVLLDACLDGSNNASYLCNALLPKISLSEFPAVMRNLAQADWEARLKRGAPHSLFDPIWQAFVCRFKESSWHDQNESWEQSFQRYFDGDNKSQKPDRGELLAHWASFSVYLPERTLELAKLAIEIAGEIADVQEKRIALSEVCTSLPPILSPIVNWHPEQAAQALDILWSLEFGASEPNSSDNGNPISVIAAAARFDVYKPLATSEAVLGWLERQISEPDSISRVKQTPWILSVLLKPFFERIIEHQWAAGRTLHLQPVRLNVGGTRPLRQRALAIVEKFLLSTDNVLASAALPVANEALRPLHGRFGSEPLPQDHNDWRPDRMEALKLIERGLTHYQKSTVLLFQLRKILLDCSAYDRDAEMQGECKRVLGLVQNTFELNMVRVLSSWSDDEIHLHPGPNFEAELAERDKRWDIFCRDVAAEAATRYPDARRLCDFLRAQLKELAGMNSAFRADAILGPVAAMSSVWCSTLLTELISTEDPSLDRFLWPVLRQASLDKTAVYHEAVTRISERSRPEQACSLISFLGWKELAGGGLEPIERAAILRLATRSDQSIISQLASTSGIHFRQKPKWALTVLSALKPNDPQTGAGIIEALGHITTTDPSDVAPEQVAVCFANIGGRLLTDSYRVSHQLQKLAEKFPKQLYEHLRNLLDGGDESSARHLPSSVSSLSLGRITDSDYLDRETKAQWAKAVAGGTDADARLELTRLLIWADPPTANARLRNLIDKSKSGNELQLAAKLAAPQGSTFVFQFPDLVRGILVRGEELQVLNDVRKVLYFSACGGGRHFTNGELDPEFHYIAEKSQDLGNRYRDDPVLGPFYRMVVESERVDLQRYNEMYRQDEEERAWS